MRPFPTKLSRGLPRMLALVGVFMLASIGVLASLAYFADVKLATALDHAQSHLDGELIVGARTISFGEAIVEGVSINSPVHLGVRRITAAVNFNPLSDRIGALGSVVLSSVKVRAGLPQLAVLVAKFTSNPQDQPKPGAAPEGLRRLLDDERWPKEIAIEQGDVSVADAAGGALFDFEGVSGTVERSLAGLTFAIRAIRVRGQVVAENVAVQLIAASGQRFRFILSNGAYGTERSWEMTGHMRRDLSALNLFLKTAGLEPALEALIGRYVTLAPNLIYALKLDVTRDSAANTLAFAAHLGAVNLKLSHPVLASGEVGPFPLRFKFDGAIDLTSGHFELRRGVVTVKSPRRGRGPSEDLLAFFDVTKADVFAPLSSEPWLVSLRLPQTPCQRLIDNAPPGLVPRLAGFRLNGNVALNVDLRIALSQPDLFSYDVNQATFDCHVTASEFAFSKERLVARVPAPLLPELGHPGKLIVTFTPGDYVAIDQVPPFFHQALVAAEDAGFWHHSGVQWPTIESALRKNLHEGHVTVGGSTISMQTAKNLWLSPERTISRKLEELFLTWHIERILPKAKILEIYMNIIEFGPDVLGINRAARHFFNKLPRDLTLAEAAYLASVLPSPMKRYANYCVGQVAPEYRGVVNRVLQQMVALNLIGGDRYLAVANEQLAFSSLRSESSAQCQQRIATGSASAHDHRAD